MEKLGSFQETRSLYSGVPGLYALLSLSLSLCAADLFSVGKTTGSSCSTGDISGCADRSANSAPGVEWCSLDRLAAGTLNDYETSKSGGVGKAMPSWLHGGDMRLKIF